MTRLNTATSTIDAALDAAAGLTGMELVYFSGLSPEMFTFERVAGTSWPGIGEGVAMPRADSFCDRMLSGAPATTSDAASDPAYADVPARHRYGITSYVGVPVSTAGAGVVGTLCAIDRESRAVTGDQLVVLRSLAAVIAAALDGAPPVRLQRTARGWQVDGPDKHAEPVDGPIEGMVLADLLVDDLTPPGRPKRSDAQLSEVDRLRTQVGQLEHALAARVVVEQAIGVLAERHSQTPREAFERLRRVARGRGLRVHDLARGVVASANGTDSATAALPRELR